LTTKNKKEKVKKMPATVNKVEENSIAQELEIESGDEILSIDDQKITDLIDYKYLCKSELLTIEVKKKDGEIEVIEIEKDFDDDLGIIFESAVFDKIKPCMNKCIFCFVDQQPKGLRKTLYIKDDDYRLSYLQGTYITLTNLTTEDKDRIEKLGLGPFYVSVHTTNPELRVKMLKNPNAANIVENLKWLEKNHIPVHLQIVLCPKYNDGEELKRTLSDLKKLKNVLSIAIVPVGITKFREEKLYPVTKKIALETIELANEYNESAKKQIACCSDEFFLLAEKPVPDEKYYGNYSQLEDGVGAIRLLLEDFKSRKKELPKKLDKPLNLIFATSQLAKGLMQEISDELNKIENFNSSAISVTSNYWGENITVAGLITSEDLIETLKGKNADVVIIPSVMLLPFTQDFLDGRTLEYVKKQTGLEFLVIEDCYSTKEIIDFIQSK
jgi:putative radical SAM enzyme (TIGR03279 family)